MFNCSNGLNDTLLGNLPMKNTQTVLYVPFLKLFLSFRISTGSNRCSIFDVFLMC